MTPAAAELSIVIPAYNEEQRLGPTLSAIDSHLAEAATTAELIVVDDGSQDATTATAEAFIPASNLTLKVLRQEKNRGKGACIRTGVEAATGQFVLFTDADLSTPIDEWLKLKAAIEAGHQVAIGSRGLSTSQIEVHQPWYRESMGKVFNLLIRMLGLSGFKDTQCGFKLFTSDAAHAIFSRLTLDRFGFDVEALLIADRLGYKTAEVPVIWRDAGGSRVHAVRDSTLMAWDLLTIKSRDLAGRYKSSPTHDHGDR